MAVLLLVALAALVVGWLVLAYQQPLMKPRNSSQFRRQQTENPEYITPAGGSGVV